MSIGAPIGSGSRPYRPATSTARSPTLVALIVSMVRSEPAPWRVVTNLGWRGFDTSTTAMPVPMPATCAQLPAHAMLALPERPPRSVWPTRATPQLYPFSARPESWSRRGWSPCKPVSGRSRLPHSSPLAGDAARDATGTRTNPPRTMATATKRAGSRRISGGSTSNGAAPASLRGGARERRRPLVPMRRHTLGRVGPPEPDELVGQRGVERRCHDAVPVVERVLRPTNGALGAGRQLHGDLQGPLLHLVVVDAQR